MKFEDKVLSMMPFEWEGITIISTYQDSQLLKEAKLFPHHLVPDRTVWIIYKKSVMGLRLTDDGFKIIQEPLALPQNENGDDEASV